MRCERIQELLLTDYTDTEASEALRGEVAEHLASCASCRAFARTVSEKAVMPFKTVRPEEPPSYIWQRIRESVVSVPAKRSPSFLPEAAEIIKNVFAGMIRIPKPALAFAAAAMVILAVLVTRPLMQERALNEYLDDQMTFLAMLETDESNGYYFDTDTRTWTERVM